MTGICRMFSSAAGFAEFQVIALSGVVLCRTLRTGKRDMTHMIVSQEQVSSAACWSLKSPARWSWSRGKATDETPTGADRNQLAHCQISPNLWRAAHPMVLNTCAEKKSRQKSAGGRNSWHCLSKTTRPSEPLSAPAFAATTTFRVRVD